MSLSITTLMTRIGHQLYAINDITNPYRGTTLPTRTNLIAADYASSDQNLINGLYSALSSAQTAETGWLTYLQSLAQATLIQMCVEAGPLTSSSLAACMAYLISQMQSGSQTVKASVVGSSVAAGGSNVGNADVLVSTKLANGLVCENTFAEIVTATCVADAQSGGATAGQESMQYLGQIAQTNRLSNLWPAGSGCSASGRAVSPLVNNQGGTGTWLYNGAMELFTVANQADGWTYNTGTAGTRFLQSTAQHYDGSSSLEITGDSSTLSNFSQQFGSGLNTLTILPTDQLTVHFACKVDVAPAAGVLQVDLCDGSGTVINDAQGNPNSFTVNLVSLGTTFVLKSGTFRTPAVLPSAVNLRFHLTTALSTGSNLFIDHIAFAEGTQLYTQGPTVWTFSNSTNLIKNDTYNATFTNTPGLIQQGFQQLFNMTSLGYLLPSSASPTLPDGTYIV
jgi:hypothetical protein